MKIERKRDLERAKADYQYEHNAARKKYDEAIAKINGDLVRARQLREDLEQEHDSRTPKQEDRTKKLFCLTCNKEIPENTSLGSYQDRDFVLGFCPFCQGESKIRVVWCYQSPGYTVWKPEPTKGGVETMNIKEPTIKLPFSIVKQMDKQLIASYQKQINVSQAAIEFLHKRLNRWRAVPSMQQSGSTDCRKRNHNTPKKLVPQLPLCGIPGCSNCLPNNKNAFPDLWTDKVGDLKIITVQGVWNESKGTLHLQVNASGVVPTWVTTDNHRLWGFAVDLKLTGSSATAMSKYYKQYTHVKSYSSDHVKYVLFSPKLFYSTGRLGLFDCKTATFVAIGEIL